MYSDPRNEPEYGENSRTGEKKRFLDHFRAISHPSLMLRKKYDEKYEAVFVTPKLAEMFECDVDQAREMFDGEGYLNAVYSDDRIFVRRMLKRRENEYGGMDLTARLITYKSNTIWCSIHFTFIDDFDENYVFCTFYDITVIKTYERRISTAYMNMVDNFYRKNDRTLAMFRVNLSHDELEDVQGADVFVSGSRQNSYSEVIIRHAECFIIPREKEQFLADFSREKMIAGFEEGEYQIEHCFYSRRKNSIACFVKITADVTRNPMTGDVIAFITEKESNNDKVIQTMLDRILVRMFEMVTFISEGRYGVIIGDPANPKKGAILPDSKEGDYDHYISSKVLPALTGSDEQKEQAKEALDLGTVEAELKRRSPYVANVTVEADGETYYKRFAFYSVDPDADFYILIKSDTTEIQKLQAERNNQLRYALEETKQAVAAKTSFLSRMSHEIRTPMNAIIGLDNIALQEKSLSPETKDHLTKIGDSAKYLLSLINDILDMSRIESGRMYLKKEEFAFREFLDQVNILAESQCRDRNLKYNCSVSGEIDDYYIGDETKLKQVLINILGNAVKFTEPGGEVSLSVECITKFENRAAMRFTIRDTGIGMDKSFLPHIFDTFSQEDTSNTSTYGGSGLGLAITKNLVSIMNGEISVDSEKGKGSVFTVDITLHTTDRISDSREGPDIMPHELHVLIVDDDSISCKNASIALEEIGITSDACLGGGEAIDVVRLHHARRDEYNLILIDLKMEDKDGIEVTREIRNIIGNEPVIMMLTSYYSEDFENEARDAGADGFLSKPINASDAVREYRRALKHKIGGYCSYVSLEGKRVLMAEDVLINAEILKQLLAMQGMIVTHAENGRIAVDTFAASENGYFDAVLMDVRMPVLDGLSATEKIRALDRPDAKTVPIIAMTANAFDVDVQRSLQAGMNAHLSKPIEPEHLYETMRSLISKRLEQQNKN